MKAFDNWEETPAVTSDRATPCRINHSPKLAPAASRVLGWHGAPASRQDLSVRGAAGRPGEHKEALTSLPGQGHFYLCAA